MPSFGLFGKTIAPSLLSLNIMLWKYYVVHEVLWLNLMLEEDDLKIVWVVVVTRILFLW